MNIWINRLVLVLAFSAVGYFAWDNQQQVFQDKGRLVVTRSDLVSGAVEFSWKSSVRVPMARRLHEAFEKHRGSSDQIVINLHSPGGSLQEGRAVIAVIENMKKTHKVITYVGARRSCSSMCVPIYLRGDERIAAPNSRWLFHEPTTVDFFTKEKVSKPEFEKTALVRRFIERYFVNSPINKSWLSGLVQKWQGKDIVYSGQQLYDQKAGVITRLE